MGKAQTEALTLHRVLRAHRRYRPKSAHHEVLEHPVGQLIPVALVLAEARDVRRGACGAAAPVEGTVEG